MGKSIDNFQPQMHVVKEEVDGLGTQTIVYNYGNILKYKVLAHRRQYKF